jgi:hypothetical protein
MAVTAPANLADEGRSYLAMLTEGDDDTDKLPKLPKKAGRPSRPLDAELGPEDHKGWEIFDGLLRLQCNLVEVAAFFGRSDQWVRDRVHEKYDMTFMQYADQVRPLGLIGLRRKQMQVAMAGDRQMLMFLGQNYLGQSTKTKQEVTGKDGAPIQTEDVTDPARIVLEGLATIANRQAIAQQVRNELAAGNRVEAPPPAQRLTDGTPRADMETIKARVRTINTPPQSSSTDGTDG